MQIVGIVGWLLASVGFFTALLWIYQVSMALLGHGAGAKVERVSLGYDVFDYGLRWRGRWWEWSIGILPFGAYTKFMGSDEALPVIDDELKKAADDGSFTDRFGRRLQPGSFLRVSPFSRVCIVLVGPFSATLLSLIVLLLPAHLGAPQLALCAPSESEIQPVALSGLKLLDEPATERGQLKLTGEIAWQTTKRIFFLAPRDGWGGPIAYLVMSIAAGLHSPIAWLTCAGVFGMIMSLVNLAPLPIQNGGHALRYLAEGFGFLVPERADIRMAMFGLLFTMLVFVRVFWLDALWFWSYFSGAA